VLVASAKPNRIADGAACPPQLGKRRWRNPIDRVHSPGGARVVVEEGIPDGAAPVAQHDARLGGRVDVGACHPQHLAANRKAALRIPGGFVGFATGLGVADYLGAQRGRQARQHRCGGALIHGCQPFAQEVAEWAIGPVAQVLLVAMRQQQGVKAETGEGRLQAAVQAPARPEAAAVDDQALLHDPTIQHLPSTRRFQNRGNHLLRVSPPGRVDKVDTQAGR